VVTVATKNAQVSIVAILHITDSQTVMLVQIMKIG